MIVVNRMDRERADATRTSGIADYGVRARCTATVAGLGEQNLPVSSIWSG